jgi:hypothetical protein
VASAGNNKGNGYGNGGGKVYIPPPPPKHHQGGGYHHHGYPGTTTTTYKQKPPPPPHHNPFPIVYYRYPTCVPFQVTSYPGSGKGSQGGKGGTGSGYKLLSVDHNTSHGHK